MYNDPAAYSWMLCMGCSIFDTVFEKNDTNKTN